MNDSVTRDAPHQTKVLTREEPAVGKLGTFAMASAIAGGLPLPWLPDSLTRRVRGALVHDIAARHGVSLSAEARKILAEPASGGGPRSLLGQAVRFATSKVLSRFGPLAFVAPAQSAMGTFALGHLFTRYLSRTRQERAVRLDAEEARHARKLIDEARTRALSGNLRAPFDKAAIAPEELRDSFTQLVDGVLTATANLPSYLVRRLDAAFDEVSAATPR